MYQGSLHFSSATDICRFLKAAQLKNFLLLGKKSILMASYSDAAVQLAKEKYKASVVETTELNQLGKIYFAKPSAAFSC